MAKRGFTLDGLDLQAGYFRVVESDVFSAPPKNIDVIELARKEGAKAVFEKFGMKPIEITGYIQTPSSDLYDEAEDQLKSFVNRRNLSLRVDYRGSTREWTVNCKGLEVVKRNTDVSRSVFTLPLIAPNPFGKDLTTTTLVDESGITSATNIPITAGGSFFAQPLIVITINSVDPDDQDISLSVGNASENTYMDITETFEAGDVITIDSFNEIIYKNSTIIEGDGIFPIWAPTGGTFEFSFDANSLDVDILATYYKRWL